MKSLAFIICTFLLLIVVNIHGQFLEIDSSNNITKSSGDDLSPTWSPDAKKILFQSNRDGNWDIYVYHFAADSLEQITSSLNNEQNPVWIDNGKSIVFDSDKDGSEKLYRMNLQSRKLELLFNRNIRAKEASFPSTEKLVYFSGFDPIEQRWEIYSFEFYYQNLNKLTDLQDNNHSPVVSPDEDHVIFTNASGNFPMQQLQLINWFGDDKTTLSEFNAYHPSWDNSGLKLYFVSKKDNITADIYSMWVDGSHLERLTKTITHVRHPAVSPDGKYLALSIEMDSGFDIYVFSLEDY